MVESGYLDNLTPTELLVFLRHLELGEEHLRQLLSEEEFTELMKLEPLEKKVEGNLKTDRPELTGSVVMILNSIFTATLGLWMGLSGFLGWSLYSWTSLEVVVAFIVVASGVVGFVNYQFTKKRAQRAVNRRKIQSLQMDILQRLGALRKEEIEAKTEELNGFLKELQIKKDDEVITAEFQGEKKALQWVSKLDVLVERNRLACQDQAAYEVFAQEIDETSAELKEAVQMYEERKEIEKQQQKEGYFPFMKRLTRETSEGKINRASWLKSNVSTILISAIPTLFGGFSSAFTYFSGVPAIAEEFGETRIASLLTNPEMKKIELLSALFITAYFAFNFLYSNYKAFVRNRDVEVMEETLVRKKNGVRKLDDKLLRVKEARSHMMKLCTLFKDLKQLATLQLH